MGGTARTATKDPGPSWIDTIGQAARDAFPTINAVRTGIAQAPAANIAAGDYARAAGNITGATAAYPVAALNDVVGRPAGTLLSGVPAFVGGLLGSKGSTAVDKTPVPAVVAPATAAAAGQAALEAGNAAPAALTPQDELGQAIHTALNNGASISDIQALGSVLPATVKPAHTLKDQAVGSAANLSQAIFAKQVQDLQSQVANGTVTKDQAGKLTDKYALDHFSRTAGMLGFNPALGAQANLLAPQIGE